MLSCHLQARLANAVNAALIEEALNCLDALTKNKAMTINPDLSASAFLDALQEVLTARATAVRAIAKLIDD